ncbi:multiple antibiotic resistance protein [Ancylobacter sp. 3268]|uniref:MarC family protein n=1 Tax=Ancylobacter sp. 3268 TaxID=2817752 RepID=UPI002862B397|nr:MarC family protein [Ancylobacter sp. 3268]MDR6952789.1 multiple antibiotic resistance protein [Ancylobacter sp. 3268]
MDIGRLGTRRAAAAVCGLLYTGDAMNWSERLQEFVTFWVVLDPIGTLPVFLAVTAGLSPAARRKAAVLAVIIAFAVLVFFALAGHFLLNAMDVSIASFQIAGGIVLFLFALSMIHGGHTQSAHPEIDANPMDIAVYPLAIPSIAGPGAMLAAVVLSDDARHDVTDRMLTLGTMSVVLLVTLTILLCAGFLSRLIGRGGGAIISRVMGMILAAMAIDLILSATAGWLNLPPI